MVCWIGLICFVLKKWHWAVCCECNCLFHSPNSSHRWACRSWEYSSDRLPGSFHRGWFLGIWRNVLPAVLCNWSLSIRWATIYGMRWPPGKHPCNDHILCNIANRAGKHRSINPTFHFHKAKRIFLPVSLNIPAFPMFGKHLPQYAQTVLKWFSHLSEIPRFYFSIRGKEKDAHAKSGYHQYWG